MRIVKTPPPPARFLGRMLRHPVIQRRMERQAAVFGLFKVPVEDLPQDRLPGPPWAHAPGVGPLPEGRLADRELPEALRSAAARYPTGISGSEGRPSGVRRTAAPA